MSRCLNKVMLIGNLGADPEIRTTGNGTRVAQFSVATSRQWKGRDDQLQEKTEWHRIVVWSTLTGTFNFVEKYLRKGDRVYIEGTIEYRSYEASDGSGTRYVTEIRATEVLSAGAMSGGDTGERASGGASSRSSAGSRSRARELAGVGAGSGGGYDGYEAPAFEDDDDLPF
jgi:single-strand DNA-binding protein